MLNLTTGLRSYLHTQMRYFTLSTLLISVRIKNRTPSLLMLTGLNNITPVESTYAEFMK